MSPHSSARGAAAIWAGHAFRAGSQGDLDQLGVGLQFDEMREMSVRDRCAYILDKVLGAPGSPDEEVLRRATLDALKDLMRTPGRTVDESVTAFMAAFVYQTTLVELTSHKASQKLTPAQVLRHEKSLKQHIQKNVKFAGFAAGTKVSAASLVNKVAELRDRALNFLKKVVG